MGCYRWVARWGILSVVLASGPAAAQRPELRVGGRATALVEARDGSLRVEAPDGSALGLTLPATMELRRVEGLPGGWVGLGTQAVPGTRDLFLVESDGSLVAEIPPPPGQTEERYTPAPLLGEDRLVGVAWIEGDSQSRTSVRAAAWDGTAWGETEAVSATTGFAQLAVSAAVLDDGSWLLVWAAVDGHDDEIYWSVRRDGAWSGARRVHEDNALPDVHPAVAAVEGGAVAAWSWLDGADYRMRMARFDGSAWELSAPFGEKGSLAAELERDAAGLRLVYSAVRPRQWEVVDLDRRGRAMRRAALPALRAGRPQVVATGAGDAALRFPALDSLEEPLVVPLSWEALP
jgi:hypothetical protein